MTATRCIRSLKTSTHGREATLSSILEAASTSGGVGSTTLSWRGVHPLLADEESSPLSIPIAPVDDAAPLPRKDSVSSFFAGYLQESGGVFIINNYTMIVSP